MSHHLLKYFISQAFEFEKVTLASFSHFRSVLHCKKAVFAMKLPNSFVVKLPGNELTTLQKEVFLYVFLNSVQGVSQLLEGDRVEVIQVFYG